MGLFKTLGSLIGIGSAAQPATAKAPSGQGPRLRRADILIGDMLVLKSPSFTGVAHHSPDRHWIVGVESGSMDARGGSVALVDLQAGRLAHKPKAVVRPMEAAVSNTGRYIVVDVGDPSALRGEAIVVEPDGSDRYRRRYGAHIHGVAISPCGRYAAVHAGAHALGDEGPDGMRLELVDLAQKSVVFSVLPAMGWASGYAIETHPDGSPKAVVISEQGLGKFRYSATGEFVDAARYLEARLTKRSSEYRIGAARDLLDGNASPENAKRAVEVIDRALAEGVPEGSSWAAVAHRARGEALEILGDPGAALAAYEKALALNPKIGAQRRATALRKKLAGA